MNPSDERDTMDPEEVFTLFVAAINRHDMQALTALLASDHIFTDSVGRRVESAASMEAGWRGYLAMCPDYWIRTGNVMAEGGTVLAVGEAGGTIDGVAWQTPAAWKAVFREGKVAEWRVFADNKLVYEILARR
ncbi:MAG TPA: nuclear transport factor 2 family protein [Candidatus Acidoferrales bacterium]|nr:nuclear transport factor 2 family protein [Candidatus Acidoferrales bacterium]